MRAEIIKLLRKRSHEFVSGEEMCRCFGISRTAIWKHIQLLRKEGFDIEAYSRKGYRLRGEPDCLLPEKVAAGLATNVLGHQIDYHDEINSTNERAKQLAREGALHGMIVIAEKQLQGKGRLGRFWYSPSGTGIWLSMILRPKILPFEAPKLTLLAGVAAARAIQQVAHLTPEIKWPNDILLEGKKVSGILTEMSAEMDAINFVIVGIGINVNLLPEDFEPELKDIATSLAIQKGEKISRVHLLQCFLREMEALYEEFLHNGFADILDEWKQWTNLLGRRVKINMISDEFLATIVDIDDSGSLVVEREGGEIQHVFSGEVSLNINA